MWIRSTPNFFFFGSMALGVSYLPKEEGEECYGVGLGLLLLVDVLLIDTVDDNAYCLVDGMED